MKTKLIITVLCAVFCMASSYAQVSLDDFDYQITYVTTGEVTTQGDSIFARECSVNLPDTVSIQNIHVMIGTEEGIGDILTYAFGFDVTTGLPTGLAYSREGYRVRLLLMEVQTSDLYNYEVKLEDDQGNMSVTKKWF